MFNEALTLHIHTWELLLNDWKGALNVSGAKSEFKLSLTLTADQLRNAKVAAVS